MYYERPEGLPAIADILAEQRRFARQPERIRDAVLAIEDASQALSLLDNHGATVRVDGELRRVAEFGAWRVEAAPVAPGELRISVEIADQPRRSFILKRSADV